MAHALPVADRLAALAARGIRARQLDELSAVVVFGDGPDVREEPGHAGPARVESAASNGEIRVPGAVASRS